MSLDRYKIKLQKQKGNVIDNTPSFSLSYKDDSRQPNQAGYEILSALAGKSDIIIEINTDLNVVDGAYSLTERYLAEIQTLALEHSFKKFTATKNNTFLGFMLNSQRRVEGYKATVYIPYAKWQENIQVMPPCSAWFYFTKEPFDINLLNSLFDMPDEEKANLFSTLIFYTPGFGHLGLSSKYISEGDMKSLLGL